MKKKGKAHKKNMRILISKRNTHRKAKENKLLHFWLAYNKQHRTINIEIAVGWYFASLTCNLKENAVADGRRRTRSCKVMKDK